MPESMRGALSLCQEQLTDEQRKSWIERYPELAGVFRNLDKSLGDLKNLQGVLPGDFLVEIDSDLYIDEGPKDLRVFVPGLEDAVVRSRLSSALELARLYENFGEIKKKLAIRFEELFLSYQRAINDFEQATMNMDLDVLPIDFAEDADYKNELIIVRAYLGSKGNIKGLSISKRDLLSIVSRLEKAGASYSKFKVFKDAILRFEEDNGLNSAWSVLDLVKRKPLFAELVEPSPAVRLLLEDSFERVYEFPVEVDESLPSIPELPLVDDSSVPSGFSRQRLMLWAIGIFGAGALGVSSLMDDSYDYVPPPTSELPVFEIPKEEVFSWDNPEFQGEVRALFNLVLHSLVTNSPESLLPSFEMGNQGPAYFFARSSIGNILQSDYGLDLSGFWLEFTPAPDAGEDFYVLRASSILSEIKPGIPHNFSVNYSEPIFLKNAPELSENQPFYMENGQAFHAVYYDFLAHVIGFSDEDSLIDVQSSLQESMVGKKVIPSITLKSLSDFRHAKHPDHDARIPFCAVDYQFEHNQTGDSFVRTQYFPCHFKPIDLFENTSPEIFAYLNESLERSIGSVYESSNSELFFGDINGLRSYLNGMVVTILNSMYREMDMLHGMRVKGISVSPRAEESRSFRFNAIFVDGYGVEYSHQFDMDF